MRQKVYIKASRVSVHILYITFYAYTEAKRILTERYRNRRNTFYIQSVLTNLEMKKSYGTCLNPHIMLTFH
jgi:hypothetical protein